MNKNEIKSAMESLMFVYSEPISVYKFTKTFDISKIIEGFD
jgi:chromosome segregation and condensation protein ScpB